MAYTEQINTDNKKYDNAIVEYKGNAVYQNDIDYLCDIYIESLPNPESIYKPVGFMGLLEYIYRKCLYKVIVNNKPYGYDYDVLDKVFFCVYIPLCAKYSISPTVLQFSTLCHIDNSHLTDVKNGRYRTDGTKVSEDHSQKAKKWYSFCESNLLSNAVNCNSIGSIFALKSVYCYNDSQTINIVSDSLPKHETAEQIAERHKYASLPEKPEI